MVKQKRLTLKQAAIQCEYSKFEKPVQNRISAHRPLGQIDLNQIFCWEYERKIQHDSTFSFSGKIFQD